MRDGESRWVAWRVTSFEADIFPRWGRGLNPPLTVRSEPFPAIPMGHVAMTVLSLQEAAERTGTSKVDIWRAVQAGALLAKKADDGGFAIDPADLSAVFETEQADQCPMAEDAARCVEASESLGTSATPETAATADVTVGLGQRSRAFSSCQPTRQRVTNCVRTGMTGGLWT